MKTYLERQAENQELVEKFIDNLNVLRDNASNFLDYIDEDTTVHDITDMLWNHDAFNEDVIYYTNAIEYIAKEDPSLMECMEIADELGYITKNLTSELLASLLKTRRNEQAWFDVLDEVADYLYELDWTYECRSDKED